MSKVFFIKHSEPIPEDNPNIRLMRTGYLVSYLAQFMETVWVVSRFDHFSKNYRNKNAFELGNSKIIKAYTVGYQNNVSFRRVLDDFVYGSYVFIYLLCNAKKNDVVIASWPTIFGPTAAFMASRLKGCEFIFELRDLWPKTLLEQTNIPHKISKIFEFILNSLLKYIILRTKKILVPSLGYKKWILPFCNENKILISRFPYKSVDKSLSDFDLDKLLVPAKKRKIIVFFGTIGKMFDFDIFQQLSTKTFDSFFFAIFGSGDNLMAYKQKYKDFDGVKFYGRVNGSDISLISEKADFGFAPYRKITNFDGHFPNKISEYLSLSIPIIHSLGGETQEYLDKHRAGIWYNGNGDDLEKKLNGIMKLSFEKSSLHRLYVENFTVDAVGKELIEFLELQ